MELMPARESRAWTLLLFGAASVVGIPLLIWRAQGDDTVGEVVQIFLVMMATGLAVVGAFMVWRTRVNLKKAEPVPEDAKVLTGSLAYRIMFVALGVAGGVAPFGRDGPNEGDAVFAAFGLGLCFGVLAGLFIGLLYLQRREAVAGELLIRSAGKGHGKQYFVR